MSSPAIRSVPLACVECALPLDKQTAPSQSGALRFSPGELPMHDGQAILQVVFQQCHFNFRFPAVARSVAPLLITQRDRDKAKHEAELDELHRAYVTLRELGFLPGAHRDPAPKT